MSTYRKPRPNAAAAAKRRTNAKRRAMGRKGGRG
jgi:hypothetical protein